jgi:hypothetical protein
MFKPKILETKWSLRSINQHKITWKLQTRFDRVFLLWYKILKGSDQSLTEMATMHKSNFWSFLNVVNPSPSIDVVQTKRNILFLYYNWYFLKPDSVVQRNHIIPVKFSFL